MRTECRYWIKCDDRLPAVHMNYEPFSKHPIFYTDRVLVTIEETTISSVHRYVATDCMYGNTKEDMHWIMGWRMGGSAILDQEIIAWQPLPAPYEETEELVKGHVRTIELDEED